MNGAKVCEGWRNGTCCRPVRCLGTRDAMGHVIYGGDDAIADTKLIDLVSNIVRLHVYMECRIATRVDRIENKTWRAWLVWLPGLFTL